jgi:glycerophosphoryl diester phosphodiesterase
LFLFFGLKPNHSKTNKNEFILFGHRGLLIHAPENTLSAYKAARDAGLKAIELDVVQTKDRKIVCSHNYDLERETDGFGYIFQKNWTEIKNINTAVNWPGERESFSLLEDVLTTLPLKYFFNIEIKTRKRLDWSTAFSVSQMVKRLKLQDHVIVSSFNPFALMVTKITDRSIKTGFLINSKKAFAFIPFTRADYLHPRGDIFNNDLMNYANRIRMDIIVWTVNTQSGIAFLKEKGVSGIITDHPEIVAIST